MNEIELPALDGTNPLGFLAALGVLDVLHRAGREPTMRWAVDLVPVPVLQGVTDQDELVELVDVDRERWQNSIVLHGPANDQLGDVKPPPDVHRKWAEKVMHTISDTRTDGDTFTDADLFCALLSEGAVDGKGNGKPTHLHFNAGNQLFLKIARSLNESVTRDHLKEALFGPWVGQNELSSLRWNVGSERLYALCATAPAKVSPPSYPGADWLAFLGLVFFPTRTVTGNYGQPPSLKTSGCDRSWKRGALRWPLWTVPLERDIIWSLVGDSTVVGADRRLSSDELRVRGVRQVMEAPIRRSEQGGYGSFGGASVLVAGG